MFGTNFLGPLGMATMGDGRPDNSQADMSALQKLYATVAAHNRTPQGRINRGWDQFSPQAGQPPLSGAAPPMLPTPPVPAPVDMGAPTAPQQAPAPPALSAQAMAPAPQGVPMPAPRPPDAPTPQPDMGFFARNSAMMRDPSTGQFIDPTAGAQAQASGPDLIQKYIDMFHKKDA